MLLMVSDLLRGRKRQMPGSNGNVTLHLNVENAYSLNGELCCCQRSYKQEAISHLIAVFVLANLLDGSPVTMKQYKCDRNFRGFYEMPTVSLFGFPKAKLLSTKFKRGSRRQNASFNKQSNAHGKDCCFDHGEMTNMTKWRQEHNDKMEKRA
jgi:hypothetical protein